MFLKHFISSLQHIKVEPTFILVQRSNSLSSQNCLTIQPLNSLHWKLSNFNHPPPKSRLWSLIPWLLLIFTESQGELGRHLQESSRPIPCSKQDHLMQIAQGLIESGFEYLQEWRQYSPSGEFIAVADHSHHEKFFFFFLCLNGNLLYCILCTSVIVVTGHV